MKTKKPRRDVMICGAYGRGNAGDENILRAMVTGLRQHDPTLPICVISSDPVATARHYGVDAIHPYNVGAWLSRMKRVRLYLSGGGSLVQDVTSTRSLLFYLFHLRAAKRRGCRVMLYGCGIGPLLKKRDRRLAGGILNRYADAITLRDPDSLAVLREIGVCRPDCRVTADPAFALEPPDPEARAACLARMQFAQEKDYFLVALRPWDGVEAQLDPLCRAIERASAVYRCEPVLFALEPERDGPLAQRVAGRLSCKCRVIRAPADWESLASVIGRMRTVISMRLHPLIFAASLGVPVAGISYDPKVTAFLKRLDNAPCCELGSLNAQALQALFDAAFQTDAHAAAAGEMRRLARENLSQAVAFLKEAEPTPRPCDFPASRDAADTQ